MQTTNKNPNFDAVATNTHAQGNVLRTEFPSTTEADEFRAYLHRAGLRPSDTPVEPHGYLHRGRVVYWNPGDNRNGTAADDGPVKGDTATLFGYADTYAYDVIGVTPSTVTLRSRTPVMIARGHCVPGGFAAHWDRHPVWVSIPDMGGERIRATRRVLKNSGRVVWKVSGWPTRSPGGRVKFGSARAFTDNNF